MGRDEPWIGSILFLAVACGSTTSDDGSGGGGGAGGQSCDAGACNGDGPKIVILDPCVAQDGVSFLETAAHRELLVTEGLCPSDDKLVAGDVADVVERHDVDASGSVPPLVGLSKTSYAFTLLARDASCGVIGFGCTQADLKTIEEVRIAVRAWSDALGPRACPGCDEAPCCEGSFCPETPRPCCTPLSGGSCPIPLQCVSGACTDVDGGSKGCDLTLLGGGELPSLLADGNQVTGPGVVGTGAGGFVIGYREAAPDGTLQATFALLTPLGVLAAANRSPVNGCSGKLPTDSPGMAFSNGTGLFVMSVPDCGGGAGAAFVPFDSIGIPQQGTSPKNPSFQELTLSPESVAAAAQPQRFEFLYRAVSSTGADVQRALVNGNTLMTDPPPATLFPGASHGRVVTSTGARAFIGGVGDTKVLLSLPSGEPPATIGEYSLFQAPWAAATAWNDRVAVAIPLPSGSLGWSAWSLAGGGVSQLVGPSTLPAAPPAAADLVAHLDNLLFAIGEPAKITIHRVTGAQGVLSQSVSASQSLSGSQLTSFDGKQVAIAASGDRLAVVWLSKLAPAAGEPTGGYAMLHCGSN